MEQNHEYNLKSWHPQGPAKKIQQIIAWQLMRNTSKLQASALSSRIMSNLQCERSLNESQEVFETDQGQHCPRSAWKDLDRGQSQPKRVQVQKRYMGNTKFTPI